VEQKVQEAREKTGSNLDTATAIIDMNRLSSYHMYRPSLNFFNEFMVIEEMHYPEIVNKGLFVNCSKIFYTIYAIVKPFIDPNTRNKLEVLGSSWRTQLKEYFNDDSLLESYGGTLKKEDCVDANFGGRINRDLYKENDDSLQHQFVKPGKNYTVELTVDKEGSELAYEFVTENHDISFGIYYLENGTNVSVVESERLSAHLGNIEGNITCKKTGVYVLEWDNSFSWARGKNLRYKFDVVAPTEDLGVL